MSLNLSTEPWPEVVAADEGEALAGSRAQQEKKENSTFSTGRSVILRPPLLLKKVSLNDLFSRENVTNSTVGPDNLGPGHCGALPSIITHPKSMKTALVRSDALGSIAWARRLAMKKPPIYRGVFALKKGLASRRSRSSCQKHTGKCAEAGPTRSSTVKRKGTGQATSPLQQRKKAFLRIEPGTTALYGGAGNERSWMIFKKNQGGEPSIGTGRPMGMLASRLSPDGYTSTGEPSSAKANQAT